MIERCKVAIDTAGHQLVDPPVMVDLPNPTALNGVLKGDLQSLDASGARYCYYVRPYELEVLPAWVAKLAEICHRIADTKLYVVAPMANPDFEQSCTAAGAGLLLLTNENEFQHMLDFDSTLPEAMDEAFSNEIEVLRSKLVSKLDLRRGALPGRFERTAELTAGMDAHRAASYRVSVEDLHRLWTEWGDRMGRSLDRAHADRDIDSLQDIRNAIELGPSPIDDQ